MVVRVLFAFFGCRVGGAGVAGWVGQTDTAAVGGIDRLDFVAIRELQLRRRQELAEGRELWDQQLQRYLLVCRHYIGPIACLLDNLLRGRLTTIAV